jgi:CubicO group peptidase (beta-lactamase class C family)
MTEFPLRPGTLESSGFRAGQIERLVDFVERQVKQGRYPGGTLALARHGKLAFNWSFGDACLAPRRRAAMPATLWLVYSNSKVNTAAALWVLAEAGALAFDNRVSDYVAGFGRHGKDNVRIHDLLTHYAGFPNTVVPAEAREDRALLRETVCDFTLERRQVRVGAFASARGLAAFYQMLLWGGCLAGRRILSPRMIDYVTRDWTIGLCDEGGEAATRGLGPQLRGRARTSGFGSIAPPQTFGHGGAGSSIAWGDPLSGVSFAYITNCRQEEAWHRRPPFSSGGHRRGRAADLETSVRPRPEGGCAAVSGKPTPERDRSRHD